MLFWLWLIEYSYTSVLPLACSTRDGTESNEDCFQILSIFIFCVVPFMVIEQNLAKLLLWWSLIYLYCSDWLLKLDTHFIGQVNVIYFTYVKHTESFLSFSSVTVIIISFFFIFKITRHLLTSLPTQHHPYSTGPYSCWQSWSDGRWISVWCLCHIYFSI